MAQEYKLKSFEKSDFKDSNGNYWCTAVFEGYGEPVKWVVRDPSKIEIGQSYYGEIRDWTSAAGKVWPRFYREEKPDQSQGQAQGHGQSAKKEWQPRDDDAIRAQWAIGQAVNAAVGLNTDGNLAYEPVEEMAKTFYAMVDRVKGEDKALETITENGEQFNLDDIPF